MTNLGVEVGLYKHFKKGTYYFVKNVALNAVTNEYECIYFDICNPQKGTFTRPVAEWFTDVSNRVDNTTGQPTRFIKIHDLGFQLSSVPTEQLVRELAMRKDSPYQDIDVSGLNMRITHRDYVAGFICLDRSIDTIASFPTKEEAEVFVKKFNTTHSRKVDVLKRIFSRA